MRYGYRLWAVDLHLGRKQERLEFGSALVPITEVDANGKKITSRSRSVDYIKAAEQDVKSKINRTYSFGMAKGADDGSAAAARGFSMRFQAAEVLNSNLRLKFRHGLRHSDGVLIDPDDPSEPDVPMKNKSTLHPFRATLIARPTSRRALLVVEARGNSCPMVSVVRGLNQINSEGLRLRVMAHLADEAAFIDYIQHSEVKRLTFDKWDYDNDGARSRREVSMGLLAEMERGPILEAAMRWCREYFGFQKQYKVQNDVQLANMVDTSSLTTEDRKALRAQLRAEEKAAAKAAQILRNQNKEARAATEAKALKTAVFANRNDSVSIDFNDVSVDLSNDGAPKKIGPLSDFRRLTYAISDTWPSDERFWKAAEETASKLFVGVQDLPLN